MTLNNVILVVIILNFIVITTILVIHFMEKISENEESPFIIIYLQVIFVLPPLALWILDKIKNFFL